MACSRVALPDNTPVRPLLVFLGMRRYLCRMGLRRSQSTSSTLLPVSAMDTARFTATLLLPSPGMALVMMIFL